MILSKYIYREILLVFAAVLSILVLVYVSHRFVRYLAEAAAGSIPADVILKLLALKLLSKLEIFVPIAFYIAVLLGLGRMYKDNEITAMKASGLGLVEIAWKVLRLSLIFSAISMFLSLYVTPEVVSLQDEHKEKAKERSDIAGIYPGQFRQMKDGQRVIYVENISPDKRLMRNVFIQAHQVDSNDIVVSDNAYQKVDDNTGERFIILEDGRRYAGKPGDLNYEITRFKRYILRMEEELGEKSSQHRSVDTLPTIELVGVDNPRYAAELQWRLSLPISLIALSLLAVIFSRTSSRGGKYAKLVTAILAYFVYNNLIGVARMLVERGELNPAIGLFPVHVAVFLIIAAALFMEHTHGTWRRRGHHERAGLEQ